MGGQTPHSIKKTVMNEWLEGVPRDTIASNNSIGGGTVSRIINEFKISNPDIDLLRAVAVKLKKENLDLFYFASSVRLKKILERLGLAEEKGESLIEHISTYCFKHGIEEKEFVYKIVEVCDMLDSLLCSLNDLPVYIVQKKMHLESLDKEISERQEKIRQTFDEYNISLIDLEEYRANRPLRESIKKFKQIVVDKENEISFLQKELRKCKLDLHLEKNSRSVVETEFDEVNKKLPTDHPLNMEELVTITDEIFYHPSRNAEIIKVMRRHRSKGSPCKY